MVTWKLHVGLFDRVGAKLCMTVAHQNQEIINFSFLSFPNAIKLELLNKKDMSNIQFFGNYFKTLLIDCTGQESKTENVLVKYEL